MNEEIYAISYKFSENPKPEDVAKEGYINYNPIVCCYSGNGHHKDFFYPKGFKVNKDILDIASILAKDSNDTSREEYSLLRKEARDCEERIIADLICSCITDIMRKSESDNIIFLIKDSFETEKLIGRLGYLGLPIERVKILFVSWDISKFMKNYIEPYSTNIGNDLKFLLESHNKGNLYGPYPEEDTVSMIKIFFYSFKDENVDPIRIGVFSQFTDKKHLNEMRKYIEDFIERKGSTEPYNTNNRHTRLPRILRQCDEYINRPRA